MSSLLGQKLRTRQPLGTKANGLGSIEFVLTLKAALETYALLQPPSEEQSVPAKPVVKDFARNAQLILASDFPVAAHTNSESRKSKNLYLETLPYNARLVALNMLPQRSIYSWEPCLSDTVCYRPNS